MATCKHNMVMVQYPSGERFNRCCICAKQYRHPSSGPLKCPQCGGLVYETFAGGVCGICHGKKSVMKKGEIQETQIKEGTGQLRRWLVQGSAMSPYVVIKTKDGYEWQCSCKAWTSHVPRIDCKHIVNVKVTVEPNKDLLDQFAAFAKKLKSDQFAAFAKKLKAEKVPMQTKYGGQYQNYIVNPKFMPNQDMTALVPVKKTVTVVVPVTPKPKTEGRKFR